MPERAYGNAPHRCLCASKPTPSARLADEGMAETGVPQDGRFIWQEVGCALM